MNFQRNSSNQDRPQGNRPNVIHPVGEDVDEWLQMSRGAQDPQTALEYAQRAVDARPEDPVVQQSLLQLITEKLARDPFVAFLAETDRSYIVTFRNSRPIVVPKARANPETFPSLVPTEAERLLGLLWWAVLGLLPAGLGALAVGLIVVRRSLRILTRPHVEPREERLAWLAIFLGSALGLLGEFFALLLILHLIG